jgi:hypothetical protein
MFSAADLSNMRSIQVAHMADECVLYSSVSGSALDDWGRPTVTSGSVTTVCGLEMVAQDETDKPGAQGPDFDAKVRLPITTTITRIDKVKITKRFGESVAPITYDVMGECLRGPSGLVLNLKYTGA